MLQCVAVCCCSVLLQCVVAVCCCSVLLQCVVAMSCSVAVCVHRKNQKLGGQGFMNFGALQCVFAVLQCVAVCVLVQCCSVLQCVVAVCCCSVCTSQKSKVGWPRPL